MIMDAQFRDFATYKTYIFLRYVYNYMKYIRPTDTEM